jgi:hypothetical protein
MKEDQVKSARDIDPHKAVDRIITNSRVYAMAKAHRVYVEEYRKSLKAILMKESLETAANAQEREAYSSPRYREHLQAIYEAIVEEETLRWEMVAAQARVEVWRSQEASNRVEGKLTL